MFELIEYTSDWFVFRAWSALLKGVHVSSFLFRVTGGSLSAGVHRQRYSGTSQDRGKLELHLDY